MSKQRTESLGPWQKGINNSSRDYVLPKGACLDSLNVDFTAEGYPRSRTGYGGTQARTNARGLVNVGGKSFIAIGGTLSLVTNPSPLALTTIRTGLSVRPVSYAERGGEVWWSDGVSSGRVNSDNSSSPWSVPAPADITLIASGAGTLESGTYRVAITHSMSDGEESHASTVASFVLSAAGSIVVTLPTATAGTTSFNVYCSIADGSIMNLYSTVSAATGSVSITAKPQGKQLGNLEFLRPLPAGDAICFHNGRLCSMKGRDVFYSDPFNYGLYLPDEGYIDLGSDGSILASVETGLFVAADKTWFYSGTDMASLDPVEILPFGAASGTAFKHPAGNNLVGWYSDEGLVIGAQDGSAKMIQRDNGFIAPVGESGSVWVKRRDGMTHVIVSLDSSADYNKEVSEDFTVSRVLYNDDATTMSVNLDTGATSRYSGWHFNSYAQIGGNDYGCDSVGLSLLEGDDDNGTPIESLIHCGRAGYGSIQIKAPECVYVAGKSSDLFAVDIILPDTTTYEYLARNFTDKPGVVRIDGMKGLMNARLPWFSTVVRNYNGGVIEASAVQVVINESDRRI